MRKQITTFALAAAVITSTSAAVSAGGLAPVEVAPTVFVEEDEGSMGSLGGAAPLLLLLLVGGAAIALSDDGDGSSSGSDTDG